MAVMQPDQAKAMPGCETIEELFAALESPLLGYALRLSGGLCSAEDLVQEAFMKLQAQFKEVREPRRWLYQTVHNLAMNRRRQARQDRFAGRQPPGRPARGGRAGRSQAAARRATGPHGGNRPGAADPGNAGHPQPGVDPAQIQRGPVLQGNRRAHRA